jgi:hypothetical protein
MYRGQEYNKHVTVPAEKTNKGNGFEGPHVMNFGIRYTFTLRPLYDRERVPATH